MFCLLTARFPAWRDWGDPRKFGFKFPVGGSVPVLFSSMWKANFSQLRNLKVKPNMAEIEAIPGRHSQSPRTRGLVQTWLRSEGNLDSKLDFFHANYQSVCDFVYYSL